MITPKEAAEFLATRGKLTPEETARAIEKGLLPVPEPEPEE